MFVLGHIGIGRRLATGAYAVFTTRERRLFLLGTLLPDLLDKPLYYIPSWITGKSGEALGLIAGTHSFGHTGLFLLALAAATRLTRGAARGGLLALTIGVTTHLILDFIGLSLGASTFFWPLLGWQFTPFRHHGLGEHLQTVLRPITLAGEIIGAALLGWYAYRRHGNPQRVPKPSRDELPAAKPRSARRDGQQT